MNSALARRLAKLEAATKPQPVGIGEAVRRALALDKAGELEPCSEESLRELWGRIRKGKDVRACLWSNW